MNILECKISNLDLPLELYQILYYSGIVYVGDLANYTIEEVYSFRGMNNKYYNILNSFLKANNLKLEDICKED